MAYFFVVVFHILLSLRLFVTVIIIITDNIIVLLSKAWLLCVCSLEEEIAQIWQVAFAATAFSLPREEMSTPTFHLFSKLLG